MKVLFVHDTKIKEDKDGKYYTGGSYNEEVWNRYLSIASDFKVIARKESYIYEVDETEKFNYLDNKRIKFIEVPNLNSLKTYINIKKQRQTKTTIMNAVLSSDIVIARLPSKNGAIAVRFAKKLKKPCLVEVVGCILDSYWYHSLKGKFIALPSYYNMKKSIKDANSALYVTNEFLQKRYPCYGKTLCCSDVSLPRLGENILETRISRINNLQKNKPIILGTTAGVNVKYKGQEYVIKAISKLNKEGYNFNYHLAGDGDNSYLKSVAEKYGVIDKVKFLGALPHKEIFDYLDNIDIYIQPSKTEGLPRALVEAMSRGCPSLGSNVGGIPELLNPEFVFNRGAVNEICNLLKKMNIESMKHEAMRSFEKANEYDSEELNLKRNIFYKEFAIYAKNKYS